MHIKEVKFPLLLVVLRHAGSLRAENAILLVLLMMPLLVSYHYFGRAETPQTKASRITLNSSSLRSGSGCQPGPGAYCVGANLAGGRLDFKDLDEINLEGAMMAGSNLQYSSISHANQVRANLAMATLTGADLGTAKLQGATLAYADLNGVNLKDANLTGANTKRVDLTGALFFLTIMPSGSINNADCQT